MRAIFLAVSILAATALPAQYQESITVARVLVDVRVTDYDGAPVTGLSASSFTAKLDGHPAQIESVTWIDDVPPLDGESNVDDAPSDARPRLFVMFVQTDFARDESRMIGQLHFQPLAVRLVDGLGPGDRAAVLSFDSHLKLRCDFTDDHEEILAAIRDSLSTGEPGGTRVVPAPSIASKIDRADMKAAPDSETALVVVAYALRSIDGPKTLLLLGWGLGDRVGGAVRMKPKWQIARRALESARVTIFALDTTFADYHDLEIGLASAAHQTGGSYAKTHLFGEAAIDRLHRTLRGRYEVELRVPDAMKPGVHDLTVDVKRRGVYVLAPTSVTIAAH